MTDQHRIDLIEYYGWNILHKANQWWIIGEFPGIAQGASLREAFTDAYDKQAKWALGLGK